MNCAMIMPWNVGKLIAESLPSPVDKQIRYSPKVVAKNLERARRGLRGLALSWIDLNPTAKVSPIFSPKVDHSNPTQRMVCQDTWARHKDWILDSEFVWVVRMVVIFDGAKNMPEYEFRYTGQLKGSKALQLTDKIMEAYEEAHRANDSYKAGNKNKGIYSQTEFVAQIVGV